MDPGGAHEVIHWAAAVVLVIGGAVFVAASAVARRRQAVEGSPVLATPGADRSGAVILATLSLGAGAIHLAAAPSHYVELGDLGAGFLLAAALQAAWARSVVLGQSRRTLIVGALINAAIVAAWAVSRTAGLPLGPTPGIAEPVGLPDAASTVFEVLLLGGIAVRARGSDRWSGRARAALRPVLAVAVVPVLGLVMLTTSLASLAIVAGADH